MKVVKSTYRRELSSRIFESYCFIQSLSGTIIDEQTGEENKYQIFDLLKVLYNNTVIEHRYGII